jgi:hypothetical protein
LARMGWQVQVTNVPVARLSLGDALLAYRGGWCVETCQANSTSSDRWCESPDAGYDRCHRAA